LQAIICRKSDDKQNADKITIYEKMGLEQLDVEISSCAN
jgi:hypothetical protein